MNKPEIEALFDALDEYADARAEVKVIPARVGGDDSMAAYFAPEACNARDQARDKAVSQLAAFIKAVTAGEIQ